MRRSAGLPNITDGIAAKKGITAGDKQAGRIRIYSYSANEKADFCACNIRIIEGTYLFDLHTPGLVINEIQMSYPGRVNVENMVAAASLALLAGADPLEVKRAVSTYRGVQRRFDIRFKNSKFTYIDDYAHHPAEIEATLNSVKELYAGKKVLGVFQPHYSHVPDFIDGFAKSLDLLDEVILLIFILRESPGRSNIGDYHSKQKHKRESLQRQSYCLLSRSEFDASEHGAGNIDAMAELIVDLLTQMSR